MSNPHPDPMRVDLHGVAVDGQRVEVHGAKSCRAPWPFGVFQAGEDCRMGDIRVEDLTVHVQSDRDGMDVILIEPTVNKFTKRRTMGNLRNLRFRNVTLTGEPCQPAIRVLGKDPRHTVEDVHFDNVTLFGRPLTRSYEGLMIGDHTGNVTFS
jgi:hypothetical protein